VGEDEDWMKMAERATVQSPDSSTFVINGRAKNRPVHSSLPGQNLDCIINVHRDQKDFAG
jgi:hypothetical protein